LPTPAASATASIDDVAGALLGEESLGRIEDLPAVARGVRALPRAEPYHGQCST